MKKIFITIYIITAVLTVSSYAQNWNGVFINTGGTTIYDLASNSTPQWIGQDPSNPDRIHAVLLSCPFGDPSTYPNRRSKYYYSEDGGANWGFIANVNDRKSGFPSLSLASDGSAAICNYGSTSTNPMTRTLVYVDTYPGLGSFILYEPPYSSTFYFFGKFCLTSNISLGTKFIVMGQSMTSDSTMRINGPSPWSSWTAFASTSPEAYSSSRGADGRIGIAYIQNSFFPNDYRGVYFIETTDNGVTFSSPIKIFSADFTNPSADSLAAFRGLSLVYKNNVPCISFETVKQDPISGNYDMQAPAKIRFWCSELPGSDPERSIVIASKENVPIPSPDSIKTGINDQFGSLSRPAVGVSSDNNTVFIVFQAFTNKWGGSPDTTNFKALYISKATGNYNFSKPFKFTPDTPLRDWSYPSISPYNNKTATTLIANICALKDSIPGTYVNATDNGQSNAELYYIKLSTEHSIGITNEIEKDLTFLLFQNYPNPFNSVTSIKFKVQSTLRKGIYVTLKVFDLTGREVAVLINENLQPGDYKINFDAGEIASGIYFYRLQAGEFSETKKLILLK